MGGMTLGERYGMSLPTGFLHFSLGPDTPAWLAEIAWIMGPWANFTPTASSAAEAIWYI
jgi:hypothetical protein